MADAAPAALAVSFATLDTLPDWLSDLSEPLIVMPFIDTDLALRSATQLARRSGGGGRLLCLQDVKRVGFIAVCNAVFRATNAPYFGYVAQDSFGGRNWLKHGLSELVAAKDSPQFAKFGGLLAFNDGKWGGALAAFGMVEREWALTNYDGDLFFPGYNRHYADVELTLIAMQQGKLRFEPVSLVVEVDWDKETRGVLEEDRLLYYKRGQAAFDRKVPNAGLRRLFR